MTEEYSTNGQDETEALGKRLAERVRPGDVVALFGGLGAGKTALARGLLRGLGHGGNVSSPTFGIINEYRADGAANAAHFDMYRVGGWEELLSTGFYDYLDEGYVVITEWSENIEWALEGGEIRVKIEMGGRETREQETLGRETREQEILGREVREQETRRITVEGLRR
jgi:tRNA threonylcarbamoyladenosine biosynthesis protein TsaE